MTKIIKPELKQSIIDYYLTPHSLRETELFFNIDRHAISKLLKSIGLLRNKSEVQKLSWANSSKINILNIPDELSLKIKSLYNEGYPKSVIQNKLGLSRIIIDTVLKNVAKVKSIKKLKPNFYYTFTAQQQQQIISYYLEPHALKETARYFNCKSTKPIYRVLAENNIPLHNTATSRALATKSTKQTCLEKYNVDNPGLIPSVIEKRKQMCKELYGADNYLSTVEFREKSKQTCLEKYGVEYSMQSGVIKEKSKASCLEKYGTENPMQNKEIKEKAVATYISNNGGMGAASSTVAEKMADTNLKVYGVENPMQNLAVVKKAKETSIKKYGGVGAASEKLLNKMIDSKRKNNTFNTSKPEKLFYSQLQLLFNKDDIYYQYKEARYPFMCDFYIKSIDTFIELNLNWTHGKHKFDPYSQEDLTILNKMKSKAKTSKFYKNAIEVWTIRDPQKFKIAKENALNYLVAYNKNDTENILKILKELTN